MKLKFGTDGLRGISKIELSPQLFYDIGAFLALKGSKPIMIGRDTRESSFLYYSMFVCGVIAFGIDVYDLGVTTTPVLAKSIAKTNAAYGVMITASHNPYRYNGIKIFNFNGSKIEKSLESEIESSFGLPYSRLVKTTRIGKVKDLSYLGELYLDELKQGLSLNNLSEKKLVFDGANGSSYSLLPTLIDSLGLKESIYVGVEPNGRNINEGVGSINIDKLRALLKKENAPLAFALDGDGDRLLIASKQRVYSGDILIALLYRNKKDLFSQGLVYTPSSNYGVIDLLRKKGVKVYLSEVGDRNVLLKMKETGANIGYESSGHLLFGDSSCGLKSTLVFLDLFNKDLNGLIRYGDRLRLKEQERITIPLSSNPNFHQSYLENHIEEKMINTGKKLRVLLRKSGTENLYRLLIEGSSKKEVAKAKEVFTNFLESIKCAE